MSFFTASRRRVAMAFSVLVALVLLLGAGACSGTSGSSLRPTTGILIRAEALTAGRGCGKESTKLFRYAVVVFGYSGSGPDTDRTSYKQPVIANVFDCFTDGAFIELQPVAGNSSYRLEVYAYNAAAYEASRAQIEAAGTDVTTLQQTAPTWTTECTATQQQQVQSLALCDPLAPGLSGLGGTAAATKITVGTTEFHLPDGRTAICATAVDGGVQDAAVEAGSGDAAPTDAPADAPDARPGDAAIPDAAADAGDGSVDGGIGPPVKFKTARIRYRIGTALIGEAVDVTCPNVYEAEVLSEPKAYEIDVGLVGENGEVLGQTLCSVTTQSGATTPAVCP